MKDSYVVQIIQRLEVMLQYVAHLLIKQHTKILLVQREHTFVNYALPLNCFVVEPDLHHSYS